MNKKKNRKKAILYFLIIPLILTFLVIPLLYFLTSYYVFPLSKSTIDTQIIIWVVVFFFILITLKKYDDKLRPILKLETETNIDETLYERYKPIMNGTVKKKGIWHPINDSEVKPFLKQRVEVAKKFFKITETRYYFNNLKFINYFLLSWMIFPSYINDKFFALCKADDSYIDEIFISRKKLIFVKNSYTGDKFFLEYDENEKKLIHPNQVEGMDPNVSFNKSIEIFNRIKSNLELNKKINKMMHKSYASFSLISKKRSLTFDEFKDFLMQNKNHLFNAEIEFNLSEKEQRLILSFYGMDPYKLPIQLRFKPEYFELAKELFKVALE